MVSRPRRLNRRGAIAAGAGRARLVVRFSTWVMATVSRLAVGAGRPGEVSGERAELRDLADGGGRGRHREPCRHHHVPGQHELE